MSSSSFVRYGRHLNFAADDDGDGTEVGKETLWRGERRRKRQNKGESDAFKTVPSYLMDYMPARAKVEVKGGYSRAEQSQRNAKQRLILEYCKPEHFRRKYGIENTAYSRDKGCGSSSSGRDPTRLLMVDTAKTEDAACIGPNYALDMGRRFLYATQQQQRIDEKSSCRRSKSSQRKQDLTDRIEVVRSYLNEVAIRGADHVQPPEDNAELLLATLNSPQRPSSGRGSLSPHSISPRKRKTRVMNATSSGGGKPTGNHTDIANLISNQMNALSDNDKESKTESNATTLSDLLGHTQDRSYSGISDTNSSFHSIDIGDFDTVGKSSSETAPRLSFDSVDNKGDSFSHRNSFDLPIPHIVSERRYRNDYTEDKDIQKLARQFDVPRGKVVKGKFIKYSEIDKTRISATKVLMVAVKALNFLSKLEARRNLKELEEKASKKFTFMLLLVRVQSRFKRKRTMRILYERKEAIAKISKNCKNKLMEIVHRIRCKKMEIIKTFAKEFSIYGFKNIAIKFRHKVLKCQRWYRIFVACTNARLIALRKLWDRCLHDIEGYDPAIGIMITDEDREHVLSTYIRKRRWGYRLALCEYILRVEGQHLLFTNVQKRHAKYFLSHTHINHANHDTDAFNMTKDRITIKEHEQHHITPQSRRISVDGTGKNALYIPQLLKSKLDMEKPLLIVFSHAASLEQLKEQISSLYDRSKKEHTRCIIDRLHCKKREEEEAQRQQKLRRPTSKAEHRYLRKLLSAVDDHVLGSAPSIKDCDPTQLRRRNLAHLRRPTLSSLERSTLSIDLAALQQRSPDNDVN